MNREHFLRGFLSALCLSALLPIGFSLAQEGQEDTFYIFSDTFCQVDILLDDTNLAEVANLDLKDFAQSFSSAVVKQVLPNSYEENYTWVVYELTGEFLLDIETSFSLIDAVGEALVEDEVTQTYIDFDYWGPTVESRWGIEELGYIVGGGIPPVWANFEDPGSTYLETTISYTHYSSLLSATLQSELEAIQGSLSFQFTFDSSQVEPIPFLDAEAEDIFITATSVTPGDAPVEGLTSVSYNAINYLDNPPSLPNPAAVSYTLQTNPGTPPTAYFSSNEWDVWTTNDRTFHPAVFAVRDELSQVPSGEFHNLGELLGDILSQDSMDIQTEVIESVEGRAEAQIPSLNPTEYSLYEIAQQGYPDIIQTTSEENLALIPKVRLTEMSIPSAEIAITETPASIKCPWTLAYGYAPEFTPLPEYRYQNAPIITYTPIRNLEVINQHLILPFDITFDVVANYYTPPVVEEEDITRVIQLPEPGDVPVSFEEEQVTEGSDNTIVIVLVVGAAIGGTIGITFYIYTRKRK